MPQLINPVLSCEPTITAGLDRGLRKKVRFEASAPGLLERPEVQVVEKEAALRIKPHFWSEVRSVGNSGSDEHRTIDGPIVMRPGDFVWFGDADSVVR